MMRKERRPALEQERKYPRGRRQKKDHHTSGECVRRKEEVTNICANDHWLREIAERLTFTAVSVSSTLFIINTESLDELGEAL